MSEQEKKANELLESVDVSRRAMLRRILFGMPAAYIAPAIATFSLHAAFGPAGAHAQASNQEWACHTLTGNQGAKLVPPTPGHIGHGDPLVPGQFGDECKPSIGH